MCRRFAQEEGIFCDASTGLNLVDAIDLAKEIGSSKKVINLASDNGIEYHGGHVYLKNN